MDRENVIKLAMDVVKNKVPDKYTKDDTSETLKQAFIEANGGSKIIDHKSFRRHPELYDLVEVIVPMIVQEGFAGDEFFTNFVDYRNIALGDDEEFWTEDNSLFLISEMANGSQSVRRQRLNAGAKTTIAKTPKGVKIYEELNRLTSGRVDFNMFVERLGKSYINRVNTDIFTAFNGISSGTTGMGATYYKSGSFAEDTLITLIDHVEAAMGSAQIIGTRSALRKITSATVSDSAKEDMYAMGYYGKFNGTPMLVAKQRHAAGTDTFLLDTSKVYVVAGNDKFIKMVDEGKGFLNDGNPSDNADLTKEYFYVQNYGVGILISGRVGIFNIS